MEKDFQSMARWEAVKENVKKVVAKFTEEITNYPELDKLCQRLNKLLDKNINLCYGLTKKEQETFKKYCEKFGFNLDWAGCFRQ